MEQNNFRDPSASQVTIVLETRDFGLVAIAKSLLDDAGIEYWTEGEPLQQALPNVSPVLFKVREKDAEEARALLEPGD
jgi:hypothetical protein